MTIARTTCIEALREVANVKGKDLTKAEYREVKDSPAPRTIERKFGGWNKAKEEAELEKRHKVENYGNGISHFFKKKHHRGLGEEYEVIAVWDGETQQQVQVHRLIAVAEYGFDAVVSADNIHHKSGHGLDNRPSNLQPVTHREHYEIHTEQKT